MTRAIRSAILLWAVIALGVSAHIVRSFPPESYLAVTALALLGLATVIAPAADKHRLAAALLLGVMVRLWGSWSIAGIPLADDPASYDRLANALLAGDGLVVDNETYGAGLRATYPPLYPVALTGFRLIGLDWGTLNLVCELAGAAAIYRLAGARPAAAFFLFPSVIMASLVPSKEPLAVALLLGNMLLLRRGHPLAYGAVAGLVGLTQPAWLPVPIIAFLIERRSWRGVALAAVGGVAAMAPWWIRNALLFGQFVPLTTSGGLSLALVHNGEHVATTSIPLNEPGRSSLVLQNTLAAIGNDPGQYLSGVKRQALRAFLVDEDTVSYLAFSGARWLGAAALAGQFAWSLAIFACAIGVPKDRRYLAFLAAFLLSCFVFGGIWLEFGSRQRAFALPLLLLWAGLALRMPRPPEAQSMTTSDAKQGGDRRR